jgi:hypothetical protein
VANEAGSLHRRGSLSGCARTLLTREDAGLREHTLWRMLYETAARPAEVPTLDVEDLDLPNRRAKDHYDQMVIMIKPAAEAAPGLGSRRGSQRRHAADEHLRGRAALEPNWAGKPAVIRRAGPSLPRPAAA